MRTTLNLDHDVLRQVKQYAAGRLVDLGKAVSDLLRRGLYAPVQTQVLNGIQVVDLPENSAPVDADHVKRLLVDEL